jgi:hypothetical protein
MQEKFLKMLTVEVLAFCPGYCTGIYLPTPPHLSLPDTPKPPLRHVRFKSMNQVTSIFKTHTFQHLLIFQFNKKHKTQSPFLLNITPALKIGPSDLIEMVGPSDSKTQNDIDIPILIVGGGPTGLLLAHLLSKLRGPYSLWTTPLTYTSQSKVS